MLYKDLLYGSPVLLTFLCTTYDILSSILHELEKVHRASNTEIATDTTD
jgi:hypothetical protein